MMNSSCIRGSDVAVPFVPLDQSCAEDTTLSNERAHLFGLLLSQEIASEIVSYLDASADVVRFVYQLHKRVTGLLEPRVRDIRIVLANRHIMLMSAARLLALRDLGSLVVRVEGTALQNPRSSVACQSSPVVNDKVPRSDVEGASDEERAAAHSAMFVLPPDLKAFRFDIDIHTWAQSDWFPKQLLQTPTCTLQSLQLNCATPELCEHLLSCDSLHASLKRLWISFTDVASQDGIQATLNSFSNLQQLRVGKTFFGVHSTSRYISVSRLQCLRDLTVDHQSFAITELPTSLERIAIDLVSLKFLLGYGTQPSDLLLLEEIVMMSSRNKALLRFCKLAPNLRRLAKTLVPNLRFLTSDQLRELLTLCPRLELIDGDLISAPDTWSVLSGLRDRTLSVSSPGNWIRVPHDMDVRNLRALPPSKQFDLHLEHLSYIPPYAAAPCTALVVRFSQESRSHDCDAAPVFEFPSASFSAVVFLHLEINFGVESRLDFSSLRSARSVRLTIRALHERCGPIHDWHERLRDAIYSVSPSAENILVSVDQYKYVNNMECVFELGKSAVDIRHMLNRYPHLTVLGLYCNVVGFDDAASPLQHSNLAHLSIATWCGISRSFGASQFGTLAQHVSDKKNMPNLSNADVTFIFISWQTTLTSVIDGIRFEQTIDCQLRDATTFLNVAAAYPNWQVSKCDSHSNELKTMYVAKLGAKS